MGYQVAALRSLDFDVTTVVAREQGVVFDGGRMVNYRWTGGRPLRVMNHYAAFWKVVATECTPEDYEVIYIRHPGANPALLSFLAWVKARNASTRVVLEVATFPFSGQADSAARKMVAAADDVLSGSLKRFVDYVVTFCGQSEIYGIPCIRCSNGIDASSVPLRHAPQLDPRAPRLLGVAVLANWQGYDRVLEGLRGALDGDPTMQPHLSLAGDGPAAVELKRLCTRLALDDYVTFHGITTGRALDRLFDDSDLALATLGIHRSGLQNVSSLKAREYCARGIPFVLAGEDESFDQNVPFALRVPVADEPIDLTDLVARLETLLEGAESLPQEMRAYAVENLSWKTRMAEIMQVALAS